MWLSTGQAAAVLLTQLPAHDSSINVFNLWQIKKTAGSKWTDFQHWQQSIPSEPRETPRRAQQQFAGTRLHQRLQQLVSHGPTRFLSGRGTGGPLCTPPLLHPLGPRTPDPSKSRIPDQGQTHTAHRLRFSTYNSALESAAGKMTISNKTQFFK